MSFARFYGLTLTADDLMFSHQVDTPPLFCPTTVATNFTWTQEVIHIADTGQCASALVL